MIKKDPIKNFEEANIENQIFLNFFFRRWVWNIDTFYNFMFILHNNYILDNILPNKFVQVAATLDIVFGRLEHPVLQEKEPWPCGRICKRNSIQRHFLWVFKHQHYPQKSKRTFLHPRGGVLAVSARQTCTPFINIKFEYIAWSTCISTAIFHFSEEKSFICLVVLKASDRYNGIQRCVSWLHGSWSICVQSKE